MTIRRECDYCGLLISKSVVTYEIGLQSMGNNYPESLDFHGTCLARMLNEKYQINGN